MAGGVKQILVGAEAGSPLESLAAAMLGAGRGIVADRYCFSRGPLSRKIAGTPAVEATRIEKEETDAFDAASGHDYSGHDFRRNTVTGGVRLAELIGRDFRVGSATPRGIRYRKPCANLSATLGAEVMQHMLRKADIRTQTVNDGGVRPSDGIED